jgi:phosphotransferase family enzyme
MAGTDVGRWWPLVGGGRGDVVRVDPLTGGASGSAVYRVVTPRGEFVLKIGTGVPARRELRFYRDLTVPVAVPTLLAGAEQGEDTALLFEPAGTGGPDGRWIELAAQLGALHREPVADWPWAKPVAGDTSPDAPAAAWAALGYGSLLAPLWSGLDRLAATLAELPVCLLHGDWHRGNILTGAGGRLVWIDWQETGPGRGPEDLALMWQRAEFDGAEPPRAAMLSAYAAARGIADDAVLRRAAVAAELRLLLLDWPPHLARGTGPARARMLRRLEILVAAWQP